MFGSKSNSKPSNRSGISDGLARVLPDDTRPWYQHSHLLYLNYFAISMGMLSAASGYDQSLMNGLQALPQWNNFMHHPRGAWLGFINAIQFATTAFSFPLSAYTCDRWGRKKGLLIGYAFLFLGAFLQAFGPNHVTFIIGRAFLGQPSAWWTCSAPLLVTELAYPTQRGFLTSLYNCGYYIGSTLVAWVTYGTRDYEDSYGWAWRIPSLLQIGIPVAVAPAVLLIPESPRYLISKDRVEKARATLTRFHAGGDETSPLVDFEMTEMLDTIQADTLAARTTTWLDLVRGKGNRHRAFISFTLGTFAQWNGVGVVSYYLPLVLKTAGVTGVTQQTLISGCLQIWNLLCAVGAAICVDKVGRRKLFLASSIGMLVSFILISALSGTFATSGNSAVGVAVIPMLFLYYGAYDIAFTPLLIAYPAEIWPYHLRARGIALTMISTVAALSFNTFINPIALDAIGWKYYVVFAVILVFVTGTIWFFYPETKGHTLEEMAVIFDGPGSETVVDAPEILKNTTDGKGAVEKLEKS
ncbi:sugar transporter [Byssothecium circinans]|uniref:Sugar transporter n=1 Tax=Byssothecium circinans TaxID=147558 RepID=A0A6A5UCZ0_9PLEO|nr:sugar transporter [Byssothecium circinans]